MPKVNGIGGVFFRARNPERLADWYHRHLGIDTVGPAPWRQRAGPTVFVPFAADTDYFPSDRQWMVNFRVDDIDGMIAQLRESRIEVETRPDWDSEIGRFARLHDPEGNPIELWQPPNVDAGDSG